MAQANADGDSPGGEHIDTTHLFGDVYFVDKYGAGWWLAAIGNILLIPPLGVFLTVYMAIKSLKTADDEIQLYEAED